MRRKLLILGLLLFVVAAGAIAWALAGLPPPKYILRYGLSPGCEPTGETVTLEGVEFVEIGPGIFRMGSDKLAKGGDWLGRICAPLGLPWGERPEPSNEMPVHWVEFSRGFWIARTEITNEQYERFEPNRRRSVCSSGDDEPADVSWEEANRFCAWLSDRAGCEIRLPTEAEWECACRGGSEREYCCGDDARDLEGYAWIGLDWGRGTRAVATKSANDWGLFDMHGNLWEWCEDTFQPSYEGAPDDGSAWVDATSRARVLRGGFFGASPDQCRCALRLTEWQDIRVGDTGFRPAFASPPED